MNVITEDDLEVIGPCDVFEKAAETLREARENGDLVLCDPWHQSTWPQIADVVVGYPPLK